MSFRVEIRRRNAAVWRLAARSIRAESGRVSVFAGGLLGLTVAMVHKRARMMVLWRSLVVGKEVSSGEVEVGSSRAD